MNVVMSVLIIHFCTLISADVKSEPKDAKPLSFIDESRSTQVPGWVNELVESLSRRYEQIKDMKVGQQHSNTKSSFKNKNTIRSSQKKIRSETTKNQLKALYNKTASKRLNLNNNTMENLTSKTLNREVRYTGLVQQRNGIGEKDYTNYSKEPQLRLLNHKNTGKFVTIHESGIISLQRQATLEGVILIVPQRLKKGHENGRQAYLRFYGPKTGLFLAMQKKGQFYGTPNPRDRNTKFYHDYTWEADSYLSVKQGSYLAFNMRGRKPKKPVTSKTTQSAKFLQLKIEGNSQGLQVPQNFEYRPSLKFSNWRKCKVINKNRYEHRFDKCRKASRFRHRRRFGKLSTAPFLREHGDAKSAKMTSKKAILRRKLRRKRPIRKRKT